uniref:Uncharacterized protein n=1 Tax=Lepeophtheirus salmonis TaxID=72036 RepID=A0A0K2T8R3_LEPSM
MQIPWTSISRRVWRTQFQSSVQSLKSFHQEGVYQARI